jgi:voltage-gated potassium channel
MPFLTERRLDRMNKAIVSGRILPFLALSILAVTAVAGFAAWLLSPKGFGGLDDTMWWAAQTVTTVGYGDVVPESTGGRLIGVVVMAFGVSAVSFITAVVTSTFLAWQQARIAEGRDPENATPHERRTHEALERIERRLEELERRLS